MNLQYIFTKAYRKIFNRAAVKNSRIDATAKADIGSVVVNSELGRYSYIGEHTSLLYTKVGSFTSISNYCAIGGGSHPTDWVSTSPVFNSSKSILRKSFSANSYNPYKEIIIGNDVWIGSHCLIKSGITIADGAVIGMGSVVTKDVGPYEIWAGNPAKLIRKRFADDTINALLNEKWWLWEESKIREKADSFNDVQAFFGG